MDTKDLLFKTLLWSSYPSNTTLAVRMALLYLLSLVLSPIFSFLAFDFASHLLLLFVSSLLKLGGVTYYLHKYMLTTPYNTVIVQWANMPYSACFMLFAIMLWMPGQLIHRLCYAIIGFVTIIMLSVVVLYCSVFVGEPTSVLSAVKLATIVTQYVLVFTIAKLYVGKYLAAHTTQTLS